MRNNEGIIANPNCCAIPLTVVLNPLHKKVGVERVLVSTYQSASGAGKALVDELEEQTKAIAAGTEPQVSVYPHQLAYNVVPGGWRPEADGYNEEEVKIVNETRKIMHLPELRIAATCVRVPVPVGHGESVFIETREPITADEVRTLLGSAPGVIVEDDPHAKLYPTPNARGRHGRGLRRPHPHGSVVRARPGAVDRVRQHPQGRRAQRGADRRAGD